jgi:excisionase family DNA binding protein
VNAKVAYSLASAVEAVDLSERTIRGAIADGSLTAHYCGSKILIHAEDLSNWILSLPTQRRT